jgi:hypothetical protein
LRRCLAASAVHASARALSGVLSGPLCRFGIEKLAEQRDKIRAGPWLSAPDRNHQLSKPDNVEHPSEIVGERSQAELTANFLETAHQERALVHPLFDCAKRMLHRFATLRENLWSLSPPGLHPVEYGLVLRAGEASKAVVRASRGERAIAAACLLT